MARKKKLVARRAIHQCISIDVSQRWRPYKTGFESLPTEDGDLTNRLRNLAQHRLRAGADMETRKWVRNVGLATPAVLRARQQDQEQDGGYSVKEVERESRDEKLEKSVPRPRKATSPKLEAAAWRRSGQSKVPAQPTKKINVGHARDQARASITAS